MMEKDLEERKRKEQNKEKGGIGEGESLENMLNVEKGTVKKKENRGMINKENGEMR